MLRLKRILQAISPQRVGPLFAHCSLCHVTTNPEPKRLNLAFREWPVSGNCSHPVYVGDFLTSNRIWLVSPLVKPAFSMSADHTFIVWREKSKNLQSRPLAGPCNEQIYMYTFDKILLTLYFR